MAHELALLRFSNLSIHSGVVHGVTTRSGGHSKGRFESLNLAYHVGDNPHDVSRNRGKVCSALGISVDSLVVPEQTHSSNVVVCDESHRGRGARGHDTAIASTDALVTASPGLCLFVLVADCTPIVLFDPKKRVIAAIHGGRAGASGRIARNTVRKMVESFSCEPRDLLAGIGPTISAREYLLSDESLAAYLERRERKRPSELVYDEENRPHLDLRDAHRTDLADAGVAAENIEDMPHSTFSEASLLYSERRDRPPTGRFAAMICLRSESER